MNYTTDMILIIRDENYGTQNRGIKVKACEENYIIKVMVRREALIVCPYFYSLLKKFNTALSDKIEITVPNARAVYHEVEILMNTECISTWECDSKKSDLNRVPYWEFILERYFCRIFLGLEFNMILLDNIEVPKEGAELLLNVIKEIGYNNQTINLLERIKIWDDEFELLLDAIEIIGYDRRTIGVLNNHMPYNFDPKKLPKKLIDAVIEDDKNAYRLVFVDYENTFAMNKSFDRKIKIGTDASKICISPNGNYICGIYRSTILVWETITYNSKYELIGHDNFINSISFSPNSKKIISGSADKTIKIWKFGKLVKTIFGHTSAVNTALYTPNNKMIISSDETTIKIWDAKTYKLIDSFEIEFVTHICVSHDSEKLFFEQYTREIIVLDIKSRQINKIIGHNNVVRYISADEFTIISGDSGGVINIWDAENYRLLKSWKLYEEPQGIIQFAINSDYIVSSHFDTIKIWSVLTGECVNTIKCDKYVQKICILESNSRLLRMVELSKKN